jgi:purine catabolism regulatory family protein/PucR-like helix-turn-helix protein/diguanylate cyclase with GGDEF domain
MTARRLAQRPDLGLTLVAGRENGDRVITWAHPIELADPTPYLSGAELVMTTGMNVGATAAEHFDYLARLSSVGVAALAFDTGTIFPEVPHGIVAAGDDLGMPVLAVPARTPFIAITRAVIDEVTADELRSVQRIADQQEAMAREALRNGIPAVIAALGKALAATVVVIGADGTVQAAVGPEANRVADLCRRHMTRLPSGKAASRVVADGDGYCLVQGLRASPLLGSHLAVRTDAPLAPRDRLLVSHGVALISLELGKPARVVDAEHRLRTAVARLAVHTPDAVEPGLRRYFGFAPDEPVVVLILTNIGPALAAEHQARQVLDRRALPFLLLTEQQEIVVVLPGVEVVVAEEIRRAIGAQLQRRLSGGLSSPGSAAHSDVLAGQARSAAHAYHDRDAVTEYASLGVFGVVLGNRSVDELTLIGSQLDALESTAADRRSGLLATLQNYLRHNGSIEATAAVLNIHRHTLRNRLATISQLLGRDLTTPDARAELWLAFKAREVLAHGVAMSDE